MELNDAILKRRSVRKFNEKKIDKKDLLTILESARVAPSAKNLQPWHFVVLNHEEAKRISKLMLEKIENNDIMTPALGTAKTIERAQNLILVFNTMPNEPVENIEQSIGAAIENMLLTATDLRIGSVWIRMTYLVEDEILKDYGKEGMKLSACVALGYYDILPDARPRKSLEEIVTFYKGGM